MTKLIHRIGNLFDTEAAAIGQGVNCQGIMGAGIAKQFAERWPAMVENYRYFCNREDLTPGGVHIWTDPDTGKMIFNIASQDKPGPNARIDWLRSGVASALSELECFPEVKVLALPRLGSGIGGLDAEEVESCLNELAESTPVDIELWSLS